MLKRILVLCSGYPSSLNPYNCTWAHTRNIYYVKSGIQVDVVIPGGINPYVIDGVNIIPLGRAMRVLNENGYDIVLSHSPNIRWHIPILLRIKSIPLVLFMHGTESMSVNRDYPVPYSYENEGVGRRLIRDAYDYIKFIVLKRFILSRRRRIHLVFVSGWMRNIFCKNVLDVSKSQTPFSIINNSLNEGFLRKSYLPNGNFLADFVTLRRLDASKFCIDLVVKSAIANPHRTFHIYGRGRYFDYFEKPPNIFVFDRHIEASKIPDLLNSYRCAMMPTRCDAQGVMVCEMVAFGMPVITSAIDISKEMFEDCANVKMLGLEEFNCSLDESVFELTDPVGVGRLRFAVENNLNKELNLLNALVKAT